MLKNTIAIIVNIKNIESEELSFVLFLIGSEKMT